MHWSKLVQDQRQDRDLFLAERVKGQQCVIDSPQARLSYHDGRQSHALQEIQDIGRFRNRNMHAADAFHHYKGMLLPQGTEGS
jgi:hypothetical protein